MKTYNSFSLRRVGLLVKRDVVENWKIFLYGCLIMPVVFLWFLYEGVARFEQTKYYANLYDRYVSDVMDNWNIAVFTLLFLSASLVMANMQTKEGRTNLLILPARNDEKFIARSVYAVVTPLLVFLLGILLADVIRMFLFPLLGYYQGEFEPLRQSLLPGLWEMKEYRSYFHSQWGEWGGVFVLSMIACAHSLYVLGGNFWRKYSFIKTSGLIFLLVVGGAAILYMILPEDVPSWYVVLMRDYYDEFILACAILLFVWTILNWYWAYRVFRLSEVVERKRRFLL
ncbi:MAG: hypothetical protein IKA75_08795 [Bacteroidaceae bacterium]|nr:hypothetical protein [Bacteroidaceae bacterium]